VPYTRTTWQDYPNTTTPITAARLNNIESGILGVESSVESQLSLPRALGVVARASVTASQSDIDATTVDVNGLSVVWTATPTRLYLTTVYLNVIQGPQAATANIFLTDGSNVQKQLLFAQVLSGSANPFVLVLYESGLSGTVTRKVRANTNVNTMSVSADASSPAQIIVQDIGPA
jgi:hypothetical protein